MLMLFTKRIVKDNVTKLAGSLDTNIVLRLLLNDIPEQHAAAQKLVEQTRSQFAVADIVLIEMVFALDRYYGFNRAQIAEAMDGFIKLTEINCNRALFEGALPLYVNHSSLSFEDCCLTIYARLNAAEPLWTFDKKLASQAQNAKLVTA